MYRWNDTLINGRPTRPFRVNAVSYAPTALVGIHRIPTHLCQHLPMKIRISSFVHPSEILLGSIESRRPNVTGRTHKMIARRCIPVGSSCLWNSHDDILKTCPFNSQNILPKRRFLERVTEHEMRIGVIW